jgi:uncharacterized protein (DUF2147 family)
MQPLPLFKLFVTMSLGVLSTAAFAQAAAVGRWIVPNDAPEPPAVVVLTERDGELRGVIEKLLVQPGQNPNPSCDKCRGERKGKPIVGMELMWGLKSDPGKPKAWKDGYAIDPTDGATYRMDASLSEDGNTLEVLYFLGMRMLGEREQWKRDRGTPSP